MTLTRKPPMRVSTSVDVPGLPVGATIMSRSTVTYTHRYTIVVLRTPGANSWHTAGETDSWDTAVNIVKRELKDKGAQSVSVIDNGDPDKKNGITSDRP